MDSFLMIRLQSCTFCLKRREWRDGQFRAVTREFEESDQQNLAANPCIIIIYTSLKVYVSWLIVHYTYLIYIIKDLSWHIIVCGIQIQRKEIIYRNGYNKC